VTHLRAVWMMVLATFLWSTAGMVTRFLDAARSFEVTFWRSAVTAVTVLAILLWLRGPGLFAQMRRAGWPLWASGACWAVSFTGFMVAMTLTRVATVLIVMATAPLLTAVFARFFLRQHVARRTWVAIGVAGVGMVWMYGGAALAGGSAMLGALVAFSVPLSNATNWTLMQHASQTAANRPPVDLLPAVLVGAVVSALAVLPLALPFSATAHDVTLLAGLGVFQLAVPCLMVVAAGRVLPAPEMALLSLLEVTFGVLLAWVGAGEAPGPAAFIGGPLVIGALLVNEWLALRERQRTAADVPLAVN